MDIDRRLQDAVQSYWNARADNREKQVQSGKIDAGTRGEVTGGTQMGALEVLVADILCEAGLKRLDVRTRTALELPGYFRATKKWDLIVVSEGQLYDGDEFEANQDYPARRGSHIPPAGSGPARSCRRFPGEPK